MLNDYRVAQLLCTRLCHDLTGPIGAINNGAEFLADEAFGMDDEAVKLINSSAREAVARLQFYRFAYGKINGNGAADLDEKKRHVEDFFEHSKTTLHWPASSANASGVTLSLKMARLMFNMIIVASNAMIKPGDLSITLSNGDENKQILLEAKSEMLKIDALNGKIEVADLTPKTVQAYAIKLMAQEIDANLQLELDGNLLKYRATQVGK